MSKRGVTAFYATFAVLIIGVVGFVIWKFFDLDDPPPIPPETTTAAESAEVSTAFPEPEATTEHPTAEAETLTEPKPADSDASRPAGSTKRDPSVSSTVPPVVPDTTCEKHNWAPATCVSPRKCRACGATEDDKLNPKNHDPDAYGVCKLCGKTVETTAAATETPAAETKPTPTACEHEWVKSAKPCVDPAVCSKCGARDPSGKLEPHKFVESSKPCRDLPQCSVCGKTDTSASLKPHQSDYNATCVEPAHCTVCGARIGSKDPNSHRFSGGDRSKCILCGKTFHGF